MTGPANRHALSLMAIPSVPILDLGSGLISRNVHPLVDNRDPVGGDGESYICLGLFLFGKLLYRVLL